MKSDRLDELERRLGRRFGDRALLENALTTPAVHMDRPQLKDNQRLEFLGDAVFGLLAADELYKTCPEDKEGPLTVRRTHLVSGASLAKAAEQIGLREFLDLNRGAAPIPPRSKMLADAMEAVMGATWLDGGLAAARALFERLGLASESDALDEWRGNPKGELQVFAQSLTPPTRPVYEVLSSRGPSHAPTVKMRVSVRGEGECVVVAGSVRAAEIEAAKAMLAKLQQQGKRK